MKKLLITAFLSATSLLSSPLHILYVWTPPGITEYTPNPDYLFYCSESDYAPKFVSGKIITTFGYDECGGGCVSYSQIYFLPPYIPLTNPPYQPVPEVGPHVVPEPPSWLLGIGLIGLGLCGRKRVKV